MYKDGVCINHNDEPIALLTWEKVFELYPQWIAQRKKPASIRNTKRNDLKQHWHKYNIALFGADYMIKSGKVEQDKNGDWLWNIFGDERLKFLLDRKGSIYLI